MPSRIVGTVRYTTAASTRLHRVDDGQAPPRRTRGLFRSPTGKYFFLDRGTSAELSGNDEDAGYSQLTPCSLEEAVEWSTANMTAGKFTATFGALITDA